MKTKYIFLASLLAGLLTLCIIFSCKADWLDIKPNNNLVIPSSLKDYQAILDNNNDIFGIQPGLGEISSGDFSISDNSWNTLYTNQEKYAYIWDKDIYHGSKDVGDWNIPYNQVFNSNIVLEGVNSITPDTSNVLEWNNVKGSALFFRAFAFYNIAELYGEPYNPTSAPTDLGIPLRLISDINQKSVRSSVEQTYNQIIMDLTQSINLLPIQPLYETRPSRPAAYALLAKVYLSMKNYDKAFLYSDSSIQLFDNLLNYNSLDSTSSQPIPYFNNEILFYSTIMNYGIFTDPTFNVDTNLYQLYNNNNDLRLKMFFTINSGNVNYKGSYTSTILLFGGLATDEMYLIRAECSARKSNVSAAMSDLNHLLEKRYSSGTFSPLTATDADDALNQILIERRKELCFRGIRWSDLRRLNQESQFQTTLMRTLDGISYALPPNDPRYILPISDEVIQLSGIVQNPR